jgi:hypothetical protein
MRREISFEWKYGIFGDDSSGSQLNGIVWRRTLALRAATNCPLSRSMSGNGPPASALVH